LRNKYPDAQIDFLVREKFREAVESNKFLNEVWVLPESAGLNELIKTAELIRSGIYNYVIDIHSNYRSAYICAESGAKILRWEKPRVRRWLLVNFKWNLLKNYPAVPVRYLQAAEKLGVSDDGLGLDYFIDNSSQVKADKIVADLGGEGRKIAAVAPGAKWWTKRWENASYTELGCRLLEAGFEKVLLLGSSEEAELCRTIKENCGDKTLNLAGKTSLPVTAGLVKLCSVYIGNDSGLSHLASAVGTPSVVFFGSTVKEFGFFPFRSPSVVLERELDCRPCSHIGRNKCPQGHFKCMRDISVEEAVSAVNNLLTASNDRKV